MNINLLPDKFVKNRAMDIILIVTGFSSVMMVLVFVFLFLFYQLSVTNYTGEVNNSQVEKVTLEKRVKKLQKAQLVDLQGAVAILKEEQQLVTPIMTIFSQVATKAEMTLLSYEVALVMPQEAISPEMVSESGEELLPSITLQARGEFYKGVPLLKEGIEQIKWVYDCKLISVTKEADYSEVDYLVRLKKGEVPKTSGLEKTKDD